MQSGGSSAEQLVLNVIRTFGTSAETPAAVAGQSNLIAWAAGSGVATARISNDEVTAHDFYSYAPKQLAKDVRPSALPWEKSASAPCIIGQPSGSPSKNNPLGTPGSTGTSLKAKHKVNNTSCVSVSSSGLVATGEQGYLPRVIVYGNETKNQSRVQAVIQEHRFGVQFVAFSPSGNLLATLGTPNDGYLYIWVVKPFGPVPVALHSSNRCISQVNDLKWISDSQIVTVGVRHIRVWTLDSSSRSPGGTSVLEGRNAILGAAISNSFQSVLDLGSSVSELNLLVSADDGELYRVSDLTKPIELVGSVPHQIISMARVGIDMPISNIAAAGPLNVSYLNAHSFELIETVGWENIGITQVGDRAAVLEVGRIVLGKNDLSDISGSSFDAIVMSVDGSMVSRTKNKLQWRNSRFELTKEITFDQPIVELTALPDGGVAVANELGTVRINDVDFEAHHTSVTALDSVPGLLVSASRDKRIQIWKKTEQWKLFQTIQTGSPVLKCRAFESGFAAYLNNKSVVFYSANDEGHFLATKTVILKAAVLDMTVFDKQLIVSTSDKSIAVYNPSGTLTTSPFLLFDAIDDPTTLTSLVGMQLSGKSYLAGIGADKSLLVYDFPAGSLAAYAFTHSETPTSLIYDSRNSQLISSGDCCFVYQLGVKSISLSPRRQVLAAGLRSPSPARSPSPTPRSSRLNLKKDVANSPRLSPTVKPMNGRHRAAEVQLAPPFSLDPPSDKLPLGMADSGGLRPGSPPQHHGVTRTAAARDKTGELRPTSAVAALETALKNFLALDSPDAEHLEPLLIDAMNKINRYGLVQKLGTDILNFIQSTKPRLDEVDNKPGQEGPVNES